MEYESHNERCPVVRIGKLGSTLAVTLLLVACAAGRAPVPLVGTASDIDALVGEWAGDYWSTETGRTGSISFTLAARGDTAYGDVIMIPRGPGQQVRPWRDEPLTAAERPRPEVLTISFVRVSRNEVNGALAPYRDPECGCALHTRFVGWLKGDTIAGTYFSRHERSKEEAQGRWNVVRKSRAPA